MRQPPRVGGGELQCHAQGWGKPSCEPWGIVRSFREDCGGMVRFFFFFQPRKITLAVQTEDNCQGRGKQGKASKEALSPPGRNHHMACIVAGKAQNRKGVKGENISKGSGDPRRSIWSRAGNGAAWMSLRMSFSVCRTRHGTGQQSRMLASLGSEVRLLPVVPQKMLSTLNLLLWLYNGGNNSTDFVGLLRRTK